MEKYFNKFILRLFIYTIILALVVFILDRILKQEYITPILYSFFPFYFLLTAVLFRFLIKAKKTKFSSFANRFMLATFAKMMICLAVMLSYVFLNKSNAIPFILSFFVCYVLYTIFEVISLLKFPFDREK
ncbi:MAG TPA: hypothetical protein PKK00_04470 [Bacteroidales bacterium]|nr:hypothetical protein [Bacteroidales bacterium]HPS16665.1 hypothetical protein [Bacteroidales bacterium]